MLSLRVRLGRRMEEIQEHVAECRDLGEQQFVRVRRTISRRLQRQFPEPFRERLAAPFGDSFDLAKLLRSDPCSDGFRAEAGLFLRALRSVGSRRIGRAGCAHEKSPPCVQDAPEQNRRQVRL